MLHATWPWPERVAQIGLSMSATNVVGFTKSSKGKIGACVALRMTCADVLCVTEAKAEISAGVTRLATRYALSGTGLGA